MRFYQHEHPFYGGVGLHARTIHVCRVDQAARTGAHQHIPCWPERFLARIAPDRGEGEVILARPEPGERTLAPDSVSG